MKGINHDTCNYLNRGDMEEIFALEKRMHDERVNWLRKSLDEASQAVDAMPEWMIRLAISTGISRRTLPAPPSESPLSAVGRQE